MTEFATDRFTNNLDEMNRWCVEGNARFGDADDVLMAEGKTVVTWNGRLRLIYRFNKKESE